MGDDVGHHVRIDSSHLYKYIEDEKEIWQVAQHAYVYDLTTVLFIVGDSQGEVIRSIIIDFSSAFRVAFGNVLYDIRNMTLDWMYSPLEHALQQRQYDDGQEIKPFVVSIPDDVFLVADTISTIGGSGETLQGTANCWMSLCILELPFPSLRRFIPSVFAHWNLTKGGSDVTTKMMDTKIEKIPKAHINMESVTVNRLIQLIVVCFHRLSQIVTDGSQKRSLHHWRNTANRRLSLQKTSLFIHRCTLAMIQSLSIPSQNQQLQDISNTLVISRRQPSRKKVNGIIPIHETYLPEKTFRTPSP